MFGKDKLPLSITTVVFFLFSFVVLGKIIFFFNGADIPSTEIEQARFFYKVITDWATIFFVGLTFGYASGAIFQFLINLIHGNDVSIGLLFRGVLSLAFSLGTLFWKAWGIMIFSENRESLYLLKIAVASVFQSWHMLILGGLLGLIIGMSMQLFGNKIP